MTKQHILQEIKRVALANGGNPPGRVTFYSETGIREQDWSGKYWPRWNDAIREAGFAPNQMTVGYEEDILIEKLILLAREIGHFPVSRELRIKSFNDKQFPHATTFENHFGSKGQLVSKVIEYCRQRDGFDDVIRMCEDTSPKIKQIKTLEEEGESNDAIECVYLIKSGKFYKIGRSNSAGRREYELGVLLPEKPAIIHTIRTDDPIGIEAYWHKRFEAKRKGGEWFALNASDVKVFKRWLRIV